ncbi:MAG: response regulator receiver protein [Candidatus Angelobacter sp.]|jgi:CheY-like chemotaxis protein|nr:response regulator receiver protein [Candidatus Angelobacter sp.]
MTKTRHQLLPLLLAEDDDDDYMLIKEALRDSLVANSIVRVEHGEELLDYLRRKGAHADRPAGTDPAIILLDLNMPKMDGRTALREIKSDPALCHLPVIVLTTSKAEEDVFRSYQTGVNAFMQKPGNFNTLVGALKSFGNYWFQIVELPAAKG